MKRIAVVVAAIVVAAYALGQAQSAPSLQGAWRVSSIVVTGANASTNNSPQPGLYIFTGQHYSIMTVNGTAARKDFGAAQDPNRLTDAEKLARYEVWNPFTANAGTYTVKGNARRRDSRPPKPPPD
jgi:hypothetical protein